MNEMIEAIRAAVADGATDEDKARGALACRTIAAALGAEPGKPIKVAGAPSPHPLAGIDPGQLLDLVIARLTAALPADDNNKPTAPAPIAAPRDRGLRIEFVTPPARSPRTARTARTAPRRKP